MVMYNIRPLYFPGKAAQARQCKTTGGYLKGLTHPDYIALHPGQPLGVRFVTECENSAGHAFFPGTQADLPDHLLQSALRIRKIGSVDVEHFHSGSFQGATQNSKIMPGTASTAHIRKKFVQPVLSTITPVLALAKVRGRAANAVNSANCVAA